MNRHLHIICPAVPWPADHSNAIDTFSQLKAFHSKGIKIHLHYYCSDLHCHPTELNQYCESIHKYGKSNREIAPYRDCAANKELRESLASDHHPVIFEGLHCTGILKDLAGSSRRILVRIYDDACKQCEQEAKFASPIFEKFRLQQKSKKIERYEKNLPANVKYVFSSSDDKGSFSAQTGFPDLYYLPLLHPFSEVSSQTGLTNFCLYHGDLTDSCNEKAVRWLLAKVFNDINAPLVVAGKSPGKRVKQMARLFSHTCLIPDPSENELNDLVSKAQVHVLPSFSYKRPELKLVHALYSGRHCVVNENAVSGTALEQLCYTATSPEAFKSLVIQLLHKPFEEEEILMRKKLLHKDQEDPVEKFLELVFGV